MVDHNKIKIIFLLPSLVPGGAERVISFVSQNINNEKFEPTLLIAGFEKDTAYNVSNVNVRYLNKTRILTAIPSIIYFIYQQKPHIVLSSISHVNTAMSAISPLFNNIKFIGREATILSKRKNEKKLRKWSPFHLLKMGFKNLDMLICQSQDMAEDMMSNFNFPKNKIKVINNPISQITPLNKIKTNSEIKTFITVGRLTEVKGYFRLLEMLSNVNFSFKYIIIGDGPLQEEIMDKAASLDLIKSITYIPFTKDVNRYLSESDVFLQGSYVEGFPNALLESCVMGTPVIAFNVPGGTREIVENGVNGFLVENKNEFIEKLKDDRQWNPERIRESVYKKFNKEKIIKDYEELFLEILN